MTDIPLTEAERNAGMQWTCPAADHMRIDAMGVARYADRIEQAVAKGVMVTVEGRQEIQAAHRALSHAIEMLWARHESEDKAA